MGDTYGDGSACAACATGTSAAAGSTAKTDCLCKANFYGAGDGNACTACPNGGTIAVQTPMEMVPHALIAQVILLRLLDPLPSLLAAVMRTFSELLEPLPAHAALVIMAAPLLSSHPQLPPQPLAANALRTF